MSTSGLSWPPGRLASLLVALAAHPAFAGDGPPPAPPEGDGPAGPAGPADGGGQDPNARGVVVRLEAGSVETPVVVHLAPPTGAAIDLQLKDDGAPPDVQGGDGVWSGAIWSANDTFTIAVSLGATRIDGGPVSWASTDDQRDLTMFLEGGQLRAEAGVASTGGSPGGGSGPGGAQPPGDAPGGPPQGPPTGPPGGPSGSPQLPSAASSGSTSTATLLVVFGAAALLLALIVRVFRRSTAPGDGLPAGVSRVPEAGVLGPGTPSFSDGLCQWVVPEPDAADLAAAVLATLARHRQVLVVASAEAEVPSVPAGPVYRMAGGPTDDVLDAMDALADLGGRPVALLVLADLDGPAAQELAKGLPPATGGAVITPKVLLPTLPVVRCERRGTDWRLQFPTGPIAARAGPEGLQPLPGAPGAAGAGADGDGVPGG